MAFTIKQFDTSPSIGMNLQAADGSPVDITAALDLRFHMRPIGEAGLTIDARASVIDAAEGVVKYDWLPEDTAVPGRYEAEVEVTYTDGSVETFPNGGYEIITIVDDVT
jgi:Rib/alpha/Esp surface antigen-like repeat protein